MKRFTLLICLLINVASFAAEGKNGWQYRDSLDKMTDEKMSIASIQSDNKVEFSFPYQGGSQMNIVIRKRGERSAEAFILISKGQFSASEYSGTDKIEVRTDLQEPKVFKTIDPNDNSFDCLFIDNAADFLDYIYNAKVIKIRATFHDEGNRLFSFTSDMPLSVVLKQNGGNIKNVTEVIQNAILYARDKNQFCGFGFIARQEGETYLFCDRNLISDNISFSFANGENFNITNETIYYSLSRNLVRIKVSTERDAIEVFDKKVKFFSKCYIPVLNEQDKELSYKSFNILGEDNNDEIFVFGKQDLLSILTNKNSGCPIVLENGKVVATFHNSTKYNNKSEWRALKLSNSGWTKIPISSHKNFMNEVKSALIFIETLSFEDDKKIVTNDSIFQKLKAVKLHPTLKTKLSKIAAQDKIYLTALKKLEKLEDDKKNYPISSMRHPKNSKIVTQKEKVSKEIRKRLMMRIKALNDLTIYLGKLEVPVSELNADVDILKKNIDERQRILESIVRELK